MATGRRPPSTSLSLSLLLLELLELDEELEERCPGAARVAHLYGGAEWAPGAAAASPVVSTPCLLTWLASPMRITSASAAAGMAQ